MIRIVISYHKGKSGAIKRAVAFEEDKERTEQDMDEMAYAVAHMAFVKNTMDEVADRVENDDVAWLNEQVEGVEKMHKEKNNGQ